MRSRRGAWPELTAQRARCKTGTGTGVPQLKRQHAHCALGPLQQPTLGCKAPLTHLRHTRPRCRRPRRLRRGRWTGPGAPRQCRPPGRTQGAPACCHAAGVGKQRSVLSLCVPPAVRKGCWRTLPPAISKSACCGPPSHSIAYSCPERCAAQTQGAGSQAACPRRLCSPARTPWLPALPGWYRARPALLLLRSQVHCAQPGGPSSTCRGTSVLGCQPTPAQGILRALHTAKRQRAPGYCACLLASPVPFSGKLCRTWLPAPAGPVLTSTCGRGTQQGGRAGPVTPQAGPGTTPAPPAHHQAWQWQPRAGKGSGVRTWVDCCSHPWRRQRAAAPLLRMRGAADPAAVASPLGSACRSGCCAGPWVSCPATEFTARPPGQLPSPFPSPRVDWLTFQAKPDGRAPTEAQ